MVLLPTYNERENISFLIPEIFARHPDIEVTVIDDNSPDGTASAVRELKERYPRLSLLERSKKTGLGDAYKDALARALHSETSRVIFMDADGSHGPEYIKDLLAAGITNDLVVGSRYAAGGSIEHWERWRFFLSRYGNLYARILTGLALRDLTSGFMCVNREVLRKINLSSVESSGYAFLIDFKYLLITQAKARATEVPIVFHNRREGESKISRHIIREGLWIPMRIFLRRISHL